MLSAPHRYFVEGVAYLVYHIALWMPTFVAHVPVDLHELFQYGAIATHTFRSKSCRIVKVAIDVVLVFIIRVLWTEQRRTNRAGEMLHVVLLICGQRQSIVGPPVIPRRTASGDVASPQGLIALGADQIETAKIIFLAQRLLFAVGAIDGKEFGRDKISTVLLETL
jgi:hypothetical protein